jgi:hypothetical protein
MDAPDQRPRPGESSYFSAPSATLDPNLFVGMQLQPSVTQALLGPLLDLLHTEFAGAGDWSRAWLAGSGASYLWAAARQPGDLDVLVGVEFPLFRNRNLALSGLSDEEVAEHLNERFRAVLYPPMAHWQHGQGEYEVTYYVNPHSWDIRAISPYAAYDLIGNAWTVPPSPTPPAANPDFEGMARTVGAQANLTIDRYSDALRAMESATNPAHRANAERYFLNAVDAASSLYDTVHHGRRSAFSPTGGGYSGWGNFLWQAGKRDGWVPVLRQIKEYSDSRRAADEADLYGIELPSTDTLIRRAVEGRRP